LAVVDAELPEFPLHVVYLDGTACHLGNRESVETYGDFDFYFDSRNEQHLEEWKIDLIADNRGRQVVLVAGWNGIELLELQQPVVPMAEAQFAEMLARPAKPAPWHAAPKRCIPPRFPPSGCLPKLLGLS
jgi:hypothetical protein